MFKNTASQKLTVFAFDSTTNLPKTGDAANITAYRDLDDGGVTVLTDTSATEKDATNAKGYYIFDLSQAETNGDKILFSAKSSTSNIVVIAVPAVVYTFPATGILAPTTSGRTLDVSVTGEAGVDWANVGSPTTTLALTGTTIAVTQKVDVDTIKTNPVVNAGTITFPTGATLASTTNITAGTITTVTTVTNQLTAAAIATGVWQDTTAGDFTTASSIGKSLYTSGVVPGGSGGLLISGSNSGTTTLGALTVTGATTLTGAVQLSSTLGVTGAVTFSSTIASGTITANITGNITGNLVGTVSTLTTYTGNTPQTGDCYPKVDTEVATLVTGVADIQTRLPAALTGAGNMKSDMLAINGSTTAAAAQALAANTIGSGTCDAGCSTTSIVCSAFSPTLASSDQVKDRVVIFSSTTTTAGLRDAAKGISAATTGSTPTFTVDALPATPASGDVFVIV